MSKPDSEAIPNHGRDVVKATRSLEPSASSDTLESKDIAISSDSKTEIETHRSWEGYASDFRRLTGQLAMMHERQNALIATNGDLEQRYERLQSKRRDDRARMALIAKGRDAVEASSAGQSARTKVAEDALRELQRTLSVAEDEIRSLKVQIEAQEGQISHLQKSYLHADEAYKAVHAAYDHKEAEASALRGHADWLNAALDERALWIDAAIAEREGQNAELEARISLLNEALRDSKKTLQSALKVKEEEIGILDRKLVELNDRFDRREEWIQAAIAERETRIADLERELLHWMDGSEDIHTKHNREVSSGLTVHPITSDNNASPETIGDRLSARSD